MNCLVVGAGSVAREYVAGVADTDLTVTGVCDLDRERASALAADLDATAYTDLDAMLAAESAPLVVNLTSHEAHAPVTRTCLDADRHVFSEKPLAMDAATAADLVSLARDRTLALGCAPANPAGDVQRHARTLLADGRLGDVQFVTATANVGRVGAWHDRPDSFLRVGPLYDGGVYPLTLLVAWFGRVERVRRADALPLWPGDADPDESHTDAPHVEATLEFADGPTVALRASFYVDHRSREFYGLECHGDDGTLYLDDTGALAAEESAVTVRGGDREPTTAPHPVPRREQSRLEAVERLADSVRQGTPDRTTARRGAHVVAVCNAVEAAAETGGGEAVETDAPAGTCPKRVWRPEPSTADRALHLPPVGFGCSRYRHGDYVTPALGAAVDAGYRLFDTAELYGNEWRLGDLLADGPDRDTVFLLGKPWRTNHGPGHLERACRGSLAELGADAFDCYALHWPGAWEHTGPLSQLSKKPVAEQERVTFPTDENGDPARASHTLLDTWRRMEALVDEGLARTLGLCNVTLPQLAAVADEARIPPALVQVESNPYAPRHTLVRWCHRHGIRVVAHSPLSTALRDDSVVRSVADRHDIAPTTALLAWQVQRGVVPIPTTTDPAHATANLAAARHRLDEQGMAQLDGLVR
ncbi:aldo/keto reductase [Halosegnis longus]|uniref:aldo/keto reductase n=1 Tax=Halosegnis longus TaxID=2216012 RepID=UPI00096A85AA|nr:aldo/keto reductase [Salella cibi]